MLEKKLLLMVNMLYTLIKELIATNIFLSCRVMIAKRSFLPIDIMQTGPCTIGQGSFGSIIWCPQKTWLICTWQLMDYLLKSHLYSRDTIRLPVNFKTGIPEWQ